MKFKEEPVTYLTRKAWRFSKGTRPIMVVYFFLFMVANAVDFLEPLVIAWLINTIQKEGLADIYKLIGIASLLVVIVIAFWAFHGVGRVLEQKNAFFIRVNYRKYLVDGVMSLPLKWQSGMQSGDLIDKIEKASFRLFKFSGNMFEVIEVLLRVIGSLVAIFYFNLTSGFIVIFMMALCISVILKYDKVLKNQYKELFRFENKVSAKIYDVVSNITTVIILNLEKLSSKEILKKMMAPFSLFKRNIKLNEVKWATVSLIASLMGFFVISVYLLQNYFAGTAIAIGSLYALYEYVLRIEGIFYRFAYKYGDIVRQKAAVENMEEICKEFEREKKKARKIRLKNWKVLRAENINFSYSEKEKEIHLDNISFYFRKGEKIAFVGESGSGKSTLLKVIGGLYETEGEMFIDGRKIKGKFHAIEDYVTLIPQEPELFTTTIKENITMGIRHSMKKIRKFARMAKFDKVAMGLPKKYDSKVNEKGVNLSGGEKQRLALARGLLAGEDKQILLLDEPTSSVDSKNEIDIYKNIFRQFRGKTIISSIHRLHMLKMFDRIYLFRNGKIVGEGSFNSLIKSSKDFKKVWKKYKLKK